jgi:DNA-binding transcriptional regulator GbsR (MarR family)
LKKLTTYYTNRNILFKEIKQVSPKDLGSRRKIDIYAATTVDSKFFAIFIVDAKSRFIRKNANDLMELCEKLSSHLDHNFKKKELLISSPLCSKAKEYLKQNEWSVRSDFM